MLEQEWWKNVIAADIYTTLKQREHEIPQFHCQSLKLWSRRHLVDWLSVIVEQLHIESMAHHLAVYLLDYFLDKMDVEHCHLYLLAMTCLRLAIKFEESCDKVPRQATLNAFIPKTCTTALHGYTSDEFLSMELTVLKFHKWQLAVPTPAHFMPYFLTIAADEGDLHNGVPIINKQIMTQYIEKHAKYFLEISLQDHTFRDYMPSLIAASCIAAARICLFLSPTWPKHMMLLSDYYLEELLPCLQLMLSTHRMDKVNQVAQHASQVIPYATAIPCSPCLPYQTGFIDYTSHHRSSVVLAGAPTTLVSHQMLR